MNFCISFASAFGGFITYIFIQTILPENDILNKAYQCQKTADYPKAEPDGEQDSQQNTYHHGRYVPSAAVSSASHVVAPKIALLYSIRPKASLTQKEAGQ